MLVLIHNNKKVIGVQINGFELSFAPKETIGDTLYHIANTYPESLIVWCNNIIYEHVAFDVIPSLFPHDRLLVSYQPEGNYLSPIIGYVEDSPFINVNKKVTYPTWQMSSCVGAIKASTVLKTDLTFWQSSNFSYALISVAKQYQSQGLFCYSEPTLLRKEISLAVPKSSLLDVFVFVKEFYKPIWMYLLLLNLLINERHFPIITFFRVYFRSEKKIFPKALVFDPLPSPLIELNKETVDVIIPTIGRKDYLYDVLCDLKKQIHLPKNVIIVEQNPLADSISNLDYLTKEEWPFVIKHIFTHQTGACNARNIALIKVESKWFFLADDDIRLQDNFILKTLEQLLKYNFSAVILSCLLKNQKKENHIVSQTTIFGSGCSFVLRHKCKDVFFEKALEHGFGEDIDFGLQLRNLGIDILYLPNPEILHLKAPIGGFRTKFIHPWESDIVQPKPSPTVMYFRLKYYTAEQLNGYRIVLFLKFYRHQPIKNPLRYYFSMRSKWQCSLQWAKLLEAN